MEDKLLDILGVFPNWVWAFGFWVWLVKNAWPSNLTIKRKDKRYDAGN